MIPAATLDNRLTGPREATLTIANPNDEYTIDPTAASATFISEDIDCTLTSCVSGCMYCACACVCVCVSVAIYR